MPSGEERLRSAARSLLRDHPDREPSTRELCEAAGVNAPTLYHHFGTKSGLLDVAVKEAFDAYLRRKRGVARTGDAVADFAAGWDVHVAFGLENPVLYALMHDARGQRTASPAAQEAERELRRAVQRLADAGLLRLEVDDAVQMTVAMAIGCVTQLHRSARAGGADLSHAIRDALIGALFGAPPAAEDLARSARTVAARLGGSPGLFTPAEEALLRQWLRAVADRHTREKTGAAATVAAPAAGGDEG